MHSKRVLLIGVVASALVFFLSLRIPFRKAKETSPRGGAVAFEGSGTTKPADSSVPASVEEAELVECRRVWSELETIWPLNAASDNETRIQLSISSLSSALTVLERLESRSSCVRRLQSPGSEGTRSLLDGCTPETLRLVRENAALLDRDPEANPPSEEALQTEMEVRLKSHECLENLVLHRLRLAVARLKDDRPESVTTADEAKALLFLKVLFGSEGQSEAVKAIPLAKRYAALAPQSRLAGETWARLAYGGWASESDPETKARYFEELSQAARHLQQHSHTVEDPHLRAALLSKGTSAKALTRFLVESEGMMNDDRLYYAAWREALEGRIDQAQRLLRPLIAEGGNLENQQLAAIASYRLKDPRPGEAAFLFPSTRLAVMVERDMTREPASSFPRFYYGTSVELGALPIGSPNAPDHVPQMVRDLTNGIYPEWSSGVDSEKLFERRQTEVKRLLGGMGFLVSPN